MTDEEIAAMFTYHAPKGDQAARYRAICDAGKAFAEVIVALTPACADQTSAVRKVRMAVMTANAAITINE